MHMLFYLNAYALYQNAYTFIRYAFHLDVYAFIEMHMLSIKMHMLLLRCILHAFHQNAYPSKQRDIDTTSNRHQALLENTSK